MSQRSSRGNRYTLRHDESDEEMSAPSYTAKARRQARASVRASQAGPSNRDDTQDPYAMPEGSQKANGNKLPPEEEQHLVATVIRYLLIADRPKTVIQRTHIIKNALPNHSKYYRTIMAEVSTTLRDIFGYNLVELEGSKYILTNNLDNKGPHLSFSKDERKELVLCFIALSHIFMCGENGCGQDELFKLFTSLEIIEEDNYMNDYFGDVKYLLTEKFVKQGYLDLVVVDKSDPPVKHYQWGARAENELTPRQVLEFMSKIFGGRPLNTWPEQFKIMQTREDMNASI